MTLFCPDTSDKEAGQASSGDGALSAPDCDDRHLIPLMTAEQIEAAKNRYKNEPKPPEYHPYRAQ
jgi:hypothetical protein